MSQAQAATTPLVTEKNEAVEKSDENGNKRRSGTDLDRNVSTATSVEGSDSL